MLGGPFPIETARKVRPFITGRFLHSRFSFPMLGSHSHNLPVMEDAGDRLQAAIFYQIFTALPVFDKTGIASFLQFSQNLTFVQSDEISYHPLCKMTKLLLSY